MINRNNASIKSMVIHKIGNLTIGTDIEYSKSPITIEDEAVRTTFLNSCLDVFKEPIFYKFNEDSLSSDGNMVMNECQNVFNAESDLYEASIHITRQLYNKSVKSNIKQSYFALLLVADLLIDDELVDGVLMCKFEIQEAVYTFENTDDIINMTETYGYIPSRLDKISLVMNTNIEDGFKILNIDKTNFGGDAKYWKDEFLNIGLIGSDYTYTTDYMKVTGNFLKGRKPLEEILEKGAEVDVLGRSADYFKKNKTFDEREYKQEVFKDPRLIDAFDDYKTNWMEKSRRPMAETFDLDTVAMKKNESVFKSVIKLDKNFHIYIHGDRKKIQKGVDEEGKKFYILYYNEEID
jgi:hypothetical protein